MQVSKKAKQICMNHGLDYSISKRPFYDSNGTPSGYYGIYNNRTNECLNSVKGGYSYVQNVEIVDKVLEGILPFGNDIDVRTAWSLNGGRKVAISLKLADDFLLKGGVIGGDDNLQRYITILDSRDGSLGLSVGFGTLTLSCKNQFNHFNKNNQWKTFHTKTLKEFVQRLPFVIENKMIEMSKHFDTIEMSLEKDINTEDTHKMVKSILGYNQLEYRKDPESFSTRKSNILEKIYGAIDIETRQKGDNLWGLFSGITRFATYDIAVPKRELGRTESLLTGGAYRANNAALSFAEKVLVNE